MGIRRFFWASAAVVASLLILAVAAGRGAPGRPEALPAGSFRATVEEVAVDDDLLICRIEVEVRADSLVRLVCDQPDKGGIATRADSQGPSSLVRLTVVGDQVAFGASDFFKFRVKLGGGAASAVFSDTGPSPGGKKRRNLISIPIQPGTYREGEAVPVIRLDDRTYSLVVDAPKP